MDGKKLNDPTRWTCNKCGEIEPYNNEQSFPICRCELGNPNAKKFKKFLRSREFEKICQEAKKPWRK